MGEVSLSQSGTGLPGVGGPLVEDDREDRAIGVHHWLDGNRKSVRKMET